MPIPGASGNVLMSDGTEWVPRKATGSQELWLPASAWMPRLVHGVPCGWHQNIVTPPGGEFTGLPFPFALGYASITFAFQKSWIENSMTGMVYWSQNNAGATGNVTWLLHGCVHPAGWSSCVFPPQAVPAQGALMATWPPVSLSIGTSPAPGQMVELLIRRYGGGEPTDTFNGVAYFIGLKLILQTDTLTDE